MVVRAAAALRRRAADPPDSRNSILAAVLTRGTSREVVLQFALALAVFLPPMLLHVLIPFIAIAFLGRGFLHAAGSAASGVAAGWPSDVLLGDLTIDLMLFSMCLCGVVI